VPAVINCFTGHFLGRFKIPLIFLFGFTFFSTYGWFGIAVMAFVTGIGDHLLAVVPSWYLSMLLRPTQPVHRCN